MSRVPSRNLSSSTPHSRRQSPNPTAESSLSGFAYSSPNPHNLTVPNNEWQAWSAASARPTSSMGNTESTYAPVLGTSGRRSLPDTVVHNVDDGWRTATHPMKSPLDSGQSMDVLNASLMAMGITSDRPSVAQATQWFSQTGMADPSFTASDSRFQPAPSPTAAAAAYPPVYTNAYGQTLVSPADDFQNVPFRGMAMPADDDYQQVPRMPVGGMHPGLQHPAAFHQAQGPCNPHPSREYGTYHLTSPIGPFTDFSFGFEANRSHAGPPQFPQQPLNMVGPSNMVFPNPQQPISLPDSRQLSMVPFDFPPPQPFFFPSSPHLLNMMPPMPMHPHGLVGPVNMANNFPRVHRDPPFPMGPSSANVMNVPPRHNRNQRSQQVKGSFQEFGQQYDSVGGVSQHGGRTTRRPNVMASPISARSALMESFRNGNKDKQWTLQDIWNHIVEFSGDQNGSRLIQQQLETASEDDRQRVFDEIVPEKTDQLIQDVFGNYVIQKFFELGTPAQKDAFCKVVEDNVVKYSLQIYACRVVQKAFEHMSQEQQDRLISIVEQNFLLCVRDDHGNHVIQKLIETIPGNRLTFLQFISTHVCEVATNSNGCRVLQKCLSQLPSEHSQPLLDAIHRQANSLMRDQYGNYVMQYILQNGEEPDKGLIIGRVRGSLVRLSRNQYASHVCEKAIVYANPDDRRRLLEELTKPRAGENPVLVMIKDDFANYVLQKALTEAEGDQKETLFNLVKGILIPLRRMTTSYNKQLVKIERLVDRHFGRQENPKDGVEPTGAAVPAVHDAQAESS